MKKKNQFFLAGFLLAFIFSFCQPAAADSVRRLLRKAPSDTARLRIICGFLEAASEEKTVSSFIAEMKTIVAAGLKRTSGKELLIYKYYQGKIFENSAYLLSDKGKLDESIQTYEDAIVLYKEGNYTDEISTCYNNMGVLYKLTGNLGRGIECLESSLAYREKLGSKEDISASLNNLGSIYKQQGNFTRAHAYFSRSLKLREELKDPAGIAQSLNNLGTLCKLQGDFKTAIDYFTGSLKVYEKAGDKKGMSAALNNIGAIHGDLDEHEMAIVYFEKSMAIQKETGDKNGVATSLNNIASVYEEAGNYPKALEYYFPSLKLREEVGNITLVAATLDNIGIVYREMGEDKKALEYFLKAEKLFQDAEDKLHYGSLLTNLGLLYEKMGDLRKAEEHGKKSLKIAHELNSPSNIKGAAILLYRIYRTQNRHREKFEMYELSIRMRDTLKRQENQKAALRQQYRYEYEKKAAADSVRGAQEKRLLAAEMLSKDQELKRQRLQRVMLIGGLLILVVFGGAMYNRFKITQKQKRIIEHQKTLVEEKQKEVIDSINYAKRIQQAMLKEEEHVSAHLPPHFIFFRPKDIVSGDFYWVLEKENHLYMTAADCTGHGVPGAFLTLLGTSFLNEINATDELLTPAQILDRLREKIIKELSEGGGSKKAETSKTKMQDGMDISMIRFNLVTHAITWAGANNPFWYISNGEMKEITADKQPIGYTDRPHPFTDHALQLQPGDSLFLLSDGFADQFGGPKGKKFKYKPLQELLMKNNHLPMEEQKERLKQAFESWKGNLEQVDDVCIIGIRL